MPSKWKRSPEDLHKIYLENTEAFYKAAGRSLSTELDGFVSDCALQLWRRSAGVTQEHVDAVNQLYSKGNPMPRRLLWELTERVCEDREFLPPLFFWTLAENDSRRNTDYSRIFIRMLTNILLTLAAVDDDVSLAEAEYITDVSEKLAAICDSSGVKKSKPGLNPSDFVTTGAPGFLERQSVSAAGGRVGEKTPEAAAQAQAEKPDFDALMAQLEELVGLENIKKDVKSLMNLIKVRSLRSAAGLPCPELSLHMVFSGNPGTGKTTVARILAGLYAAMGVLSKGQLVEVDRSGLVAGYVGQTALKTQEVIQSALGGVLFIDEAYSLKSNDQDSFGAEAIDTLLKRLEDDRGKFICIVAGYTDNMHDFIDSNPGLKSRFTQTIHFDDYTPDELTQIFINLCKGKNFTVDEETKAAIHRQFEQLYLRRDKNFGNAREARRIFDQAVEKQSQRLVNMMGDPNFKDEDMYRITSADLPMAQSEKARPLDEVLNELDDFIGMRSVKNMIRRLAVQSMFMKQRAAAGAGKVQQMSMNFILTGNPGTGKTSVARKMGEILQAMEILPTSRVIEASRATLVGKYMGETPKIVNNMCDKAMGGILFIDEAYTLSSENDQYGKEAIDTLMKRMEDDRGKFVVIAAGYRDEMETFLAVNPGLASRFSHKMHIDDYNEDELLAIFKKMAQKDNYKLTPEAEFKLLDVICHMVINKNESFGNAREMRNLLDATIQQLSLRVSEMPQGEITQETYQLIVPEDIKE